MAVPRSWVSIAATWVTMFLFHYQPGVDPVALLHWLRETYFSSYKTMFIGMTIIMLNVAWIIPHIFYTIVYHIQHPFFEQYSLQVWAWENAEAEAKAAETQTEVEYPEPVSSAWGVRAISRARRTAIAFYKQIKHGAQWVFTEHVYQSATTTLAMYWLLRGVSEETLKNYVDQCPGFMYRSYQLLVGCLLFETVFYWGHRFLHYPEWYKYHKDHHSFDAPVVLNAKLFHPVDTFFSSTLPGMIPFLVFWSDFHIYTFWVWSTMHIWHSAYVHSGYDFPYNVFMVIPFGEHAPQHNFHHSHNVDNFGALWLFWDQLCGTNQVWRKHEEAQIAAMKARAEGKPVPKVSPVDPMGRVYVLDGEPVDVPKESSDDTAPAKGAPKAKGSSKGSASAKAKGSAKGKSPAKGMKSA